MQTSYKILFLEDEPTIREVLKEYMSITGYEVTTVERGDQALELLSHNAYDGAVLDIMVPGINGFEVLKYIRGHMPQMAVIMLTALDDEKTQVQAFNLYADDYIINSVKADGDSFKADSRRHAERTRRAQRAYFAAGSVLCLL